jgi:hypothetical protein
MLGLCKKSMASVLTIIVMSAFKICIVLYVHVLPLKKLPPNGFSGILLYFRALLIAYLFSLSRTDKIKSDVFVAAYQRMQLC